MSEPLVALAGSPNTGKTSLFNRLTGSSARTGNYPGVTVDRQVGRWKVTGEATVQLLDVPGAYSLAARSAEEEVAVRALFGLDGPRPAAVVAVVDATQLFRGLYLVLQLLEANLPVVVALNLVDAARAQGFAPDVAAVEAALGVPVVAVSAKTGEGLEALRERVAVVLAEPARGRAQPAIDYPAALLADADAVGRLYDIADPAERRARALWALLSIANGDELTTVPPEIRAEVARRRSAAAAAERDLDGELVGARWALIDALQLGAQPSADRVTVSDRIDRVLLHPIAGGAIFLLVMGLVFEALFAWSDPAIGAIEALFGWVGGRARDGLGEGLFADFVVDGAIAGVGSVVVFLPQILLLFLFLVLLEDSGYLARVAFLVDRVMRAVGLHGRAFVPMLSGYACAVPAIAATRTLERSRDRLLTMLVIPLMTCSARLPVYTLMIGAVVPAEGRLFGVLPAQPATMVAMYLLSTLFALAAAALLGRTVVPGEPVPLLLELPAYRMPRPSVVARLVLRRAWSFVAESGQVILVCSIILWALLTFPRELPLSQDFTAAQAAAVDEETRAALQAEEASERLAGSYGGRLGRALEPVIEPLGFDWKTGIGLVGAFAAREVFLSTMGVVHGIVADDDEGTRLRDHLRAEKRPDGTPRWGLLEGLSLMVFFALSAQCMSTLAAVKRESRSWKWPAFLFAYMTALAWLASLIVYQGGKALGL